jgi:hypothetical protein
MPYGVSVSWVAILVASIASFIIGWIWYGPLFGKTWMKLNKIGKKEIADAKKKGMAGMMILAFVGTLITAYVLDTFLWALGTTSVGGALQLALWIWLGFILATTVLGSVLWDNKPWGLFVLNGAYWLVTLEVLSLVLFYWPR